MKVGDYVTYRIPQSARSDAFNYGRLCAIEVYQDDHGERTWYYVRWIDGNGKPDERMDKVALAEIRPTDVQAAQDKWAKAETPPHMNQRIM